MNTCRLRHLIHRYGHLGILLVGAYLLGHSLLSRRRWLSLGIVFGFLGLCGLIVIPSSIRQQAPLKKALNTVPSQTEQTYGFVSYVTTGINTNILIKGKEIPIQFSRQSNPVAVDSLFALGWHIYGPNTDGTEIHGKPRLFVIGTLDPAIKRTPDGPTFPTSEAYQDFTLRHWYILTPFEEYYYVESSDGIEDPRRRTRYQLLRDDFEDFKGQEHFDVSQYQRPRTNERNSD